MALVLFDKQHEIDNIWTFRFNPSTHPNWSAGQFVQVELPHNDPDDEGTQRWFTNASAPYEGIVQITTRITDSTFKQALSHLNNGDELDLIAEPDGKFVWQDSEFPKVFVAAGIGVTPYHSILKQRAHDGDALDVTLIYAGRTRDLPFMEQLDAWHQADSRLRVHYLIGQPINTAQLQKLVPNLAETLVYLSGPEGMVRAVSAELKEHGHPAPQIKRDMFPGYDEQNF